VLLSLAIDNIYKKKILQERTKKESKDERKGGIRKGRNK
jgi:hypothetical protein